MFHNRRSVNSSVFSQHRKIWTGKSILYIWISRTIGGKTNTQINYAFFKHNTIWNTCLLVLISFANMYQIIRLQSNTTRKVYKSNFPILFFMASLNISTVFTSFISLGCIAHILGTKNEMLSIPLPTEFTIGTSKCEAWRRS